MELGMDAAADAMNGVTTQAIMPIVQLSDTDIGNPL